MKASEKQRRRPVARDCGSRVGGDYDVSRNERGEVMGLFCLHCPPDRHPFVAGRMEYRRGTDRSGRGRYNRMRAAMLKHIYECHSEVLQESRRAS